MLATLLVGEEKTVYVRCDKQQRGATPKTAQTRIEARNHWHRATQSPWMAQNSPRGRSPALMGGTVETANE